MELDKRPQYAQRSLVCLSLLDSLRNLQNLSSLQPKKKKRKRKGALKALEENVSHHFHTRQQPPWSLVQGASSFALCVTQTLLFHSEVTSHGVTVVTGCGRGWPRRERWR